MIYKKGCTSFPPFQGFSNITFMLTFMLISDVFYVLGCEEFSFYLV